jgi:hypothetical protein
MDSDLSPGNEASREPGPEKQPDHYCPVCGAALIQEKCKVVCRSPQCVYRFIFNCAEF